MDGKGQDAPAIGIDLGTTNSCVAVWMHGQDRVEIIVNENGNRTTPSYVSFGEFERETGDGAKHHAFMDPYNTVFDAKRLIGRRFSDSSVQEDMRLWPFKVIEGPADTPKLVVKHNGQEKQFLAEEISSMVLRKMKESAEEYLGKAVKNAVITVPAYFNDSQRQATKNAGINAGLNVLRMINEPTAAAIAYGLDNKSDIVGKINTLIFDLGGGTFDVSLISIEEGGIFEVKAVGGDPHLGGEDFNNRMVDHCVQEFKRKWNIDLTGDKKALGRLRFACEKAKRTLSGTSQAIIEVYCLHKGIDFSMKLTRSKFEELNMELFNKCIKILETCLSDAKVNKSCVDQVVLVGGSTRIPKVQHMLQEFFDVKKLCKSVNPDEVVAHGAAIMASKLSGNNDKSVQNVVIRDVIPLSLGIETRGDMFSVIIPRNTPMPISNVVTCSTAFDNLTYLDIKVYQGERSKSSDNHFMGKFKISGIPPAPKGVQKVTVCFEIDANGILTVSAGIISNGKTEKLTVANANKILSTDQIEKIINDAEVYKVDDQIFKKTAETRKALEDYLYKVNNLIKNKVQHKKLKEIEKAMTETTKWLNDNQSASFAQLYLKKEHLEFVCKPLFQSRNPSCCFPF